VVEAALDQHSFNKNSFTKPHKEAILHCLVERYAANTFYNALPDMLLIPIKQICHGEMLEPDRIAHCKTCAACVTGFEITLPLQQ